MKQIFMILMVVGLVLAIGPGCQKSQGGDVKVVVEWEAPGDRMPVQGDSSIWVPCTAYDLRMSKDSISDSSWTAATQIPGLGAPKPMGELESYTIVGLDPNYKYYFAAKSIDAKGNRSRMSNVVSFLTPDTDPPTQITTLRVRLAP